MQPDQALKARELSILFILFAASPLFDALILPQIAAADPRMLTGGILARIGGIALCFELLVRRRGERQLVVKGLTISGASLLQGLLGAVLLFLVAQGLTIGLSATGLLNDNHFIQKLREFKPDSTQLVMMGLSVVVAAGFEEAFWRAYILTRLQNLGFPTWAAIGLSTVVFALAHLYQGWIGFTTSLVLAVVLCLLWFWRRNYWIIALSHGLYNLAVLILTTR